MSATFGRDNGGEPLFDPQHLYDELTGQSPPVPVADWFGKANAFTCPLGYQPGTGKLLLQRDSLNRLDLSAEHTLTFDDGTTRTAFKRLHVTNAVCVTPGKPADPQAVYLVDVADRRARLARGPINNAAYNVPEDDWYATVTLNGSVPWTWATLAQDLWNQCGDLGTWPGLPAWAAGSTLSPHGRPEGFAFWNDSAWYGLNVVMDRLGCAVKYDPFADTFSLVIVGDTDAALDKSLAKLAARRNWDYEPLALPALKAACTVSVGFPRLTCDPSLNPYCLMDVSKGTGVGESEGTGCDFGATNRFLPDDLRCRDDDDGSGTGSGPDYDGRATERYADYVRLVERGSSPLSRVYNGAQKLTPGKLLKSVAWEDRGLAMLTHVYRGPNVLPPLALWEAYAARPSCKGGLVTLRQWRCCAGVMEKRDVTVSGISVVQRGEWVSGDPCTESEDENVI